MRVVGKRLWFEYHCWESPKSSDAQLWYRSHQQVRVLRMTERGGPWATPELRGENGEPRVYAVRFDDGHIGAAFEDELMIAQASFYCDDPPAAPQASALTGG
ncbi:hypothetical protein LCGC14_1990690 [marine sediment metagenome]|uniref:Uncharacterized protein n=1 Tax=marine sediment metagenome TaxID=412755 RepID=A0A0F9HJJ1_9ZZZZ